VLSRARWRRGRRIRHARASRMRLAVRGPRRGPSGIEAKSAAPAIHGGICGCRGLRIAEIAPFHRGWRLAGGVGEGAGSWCSGWLVRHAGRKTRAGAAGERYAVDALVAPLRCSRDYTCDVTICVEIDPGTHMLCTWLCHQKRV
jgi:hypothetical protein